MKRCWAEGARNEEMVFHTKKGRPVDLSVSVSHLRDSENTKVGIVISGRDIRERKRAEEKVIYLANYDALTGLPNRNLFLERLDQALARSSWRKRLLAVLLLDLDHFKRVNDALGHAIGNQLLRSVAKRLSDLMRQGDTVALMGGDEFVFLVNDMAQTEDIFLIIQKLTEALSKPFEIEGKEFFMTASMGVSFYPNDGNVSETLLKNADIAMYRAKEGRNTFQLYSADLYAKTSGQLEVEITEGALMQNVEEAIKTLHAFHNMGIEISIDDFGTGYSSLNYLRQFPVNTLKIDRSFIREMTVNANDVKIVRGIINLAHSLDLRVIAEGVETDEQYHLLRSLNCEEMQGFLFSRPLPSAEFEKLVLSNASNAILMKR